MLHDWMQRLRAWAEKDGRGYPDWATRYLPLLRLLRGRDLARCRILEIGANRNGLARFADVPVIAADINAGHLREAMECPQVIPAAADITALPFPDGAFDLCVCMDTFEHLPEGVREKAADEILRVLHPAGTAVVAFPSGAAAYAAEQRIQAAYRKLTGRGIPWFEEHEAMGLPDADTICFRFRDRAADTHRVRLTGNTSLRIWEWMWRVLMCNWPGRGNGVFQALLRGAAPVLARMHRPPCYRAMILIEPRAEKRRRG
jgi:SAM-dependent methyltransferase